MADKLISFYDVPVVLKDLGNGTYAPQIAINTSAGIGALPTYTRYSSQEIVVKSTGNPGTDFVSFNALPVTGAVEIFNDTDLSASPGAILEIRMPGGGWSMYLRIGQHMTLYGITNMNQILIRRQDLNDAPMIARAWVYSA